MISKVAPLPVHLWPGGCGYISYDVKDVSYDPSWIRVVFV